MEIYRGSIGWIQQVRFQDSTSVLGAGKTGVVYNVAGLTCYYKRNKAATATVVSLVDMTLGTWASGGLKEVSSANMPGLYEFGIPDAALAVGDGSTEVTIQFEDSTHSLVCAPLKIDLVLVPKQVAAIPNLAYGANGGLPTLNANLDIQSDVLHWRGTQPNILAGGKVDSVNNGISGTASAGSSTSITLAGASSVDNFYKYALVQIIGGTGIGQVRVILEYIGSTKVATVGKPWTTAPDNTSVYCVIPYVEPEIAHSGIAQAGSTTTTIVLSALASASNNVFIGNVIALVGGTGNLQSRIITAYNGTSKVATVDQAWDFTPDTSTIYKILTMGRAWADVFQWNGAAVATPATPGYPVVTGKVGSGTGEFALNSGRIDAQVKGLDADTVNASVLATSAVTELAAGVLTAALTGSETADTLADRLNQIVVLTTRLNATRATKLDSLLASGSVASSTEVTAIQNNTRVVKVVPSTMERPDSGTLSYVIHLYLYDETGNMEVPDSIPTIHVENQSGVSRDSKLDSTTMTLVGTGHYTSIYTITTSEVVGEQENWTFTVVEGGATRIYGDNSIVVDTSAVDFSSADRTKLDALFNMKPSKTYFTATNNATGDPELPGMTGALPVGAFANIPLVDVSSLALIKAVTDKFIFDGSNYVEVNVQFMAAAIISAIRSGLSTLTGSDITALLTSFGVAKTSELPPAPHNVNIDDILTILVGVGLETRFDTIDINIAALNNAMDGVSTFDPLTDEVMVGEMKSSALQDFFLVNSGEDDSDAIIGSVMGEILHNIATPLSVREEMDLNSTQLARIAAKTDLLLPGGTTIVSPVDPITGNLTLIRGDDYTVASGRPLPTWSSNDWTGYDLSNADSVTFHAKTKYSDVIFSIPMNILSDTSVRLQLETEDSTNLALGKDVYSFDVEAVLFTGDIITLALGKITVIGDIP